jgi:DNA-binding GntR family transcriptional regulator
METSFVAKLRAALAALEAGDAAGACESLQDFINHAEAQAGKALEPEEASLIIGEAQAIRSALGCA